MASPSTQVTAGAHDIRISNPDRVYFPLRGETKLDLAQYYLSVSDGIVRALRDRPCMLHRFPTGVTGQKVHQKRLPSGAPPWVETVQIHFPRWNRTADELCVTSIADVIWAVQMSTVEFHPWNSRRFDIARTTKRAAEVVDGAPAESAAEAEREEQRRLLEAPDEWRIDLDPMPDCPFSRVRTVAGVAHEVLSELGIEGYPKTSGGNGLHIYVRIRPDWGFHDVRRAALAFGREVERRAPSETTTTWWRKDRPSDVVFVDYNQNARDHTMAAAYSVRGNPRGTVSAPLLWSEVDEAEPDDFTIATMPSRYAAVGDLTAGIDHTAYGLETLLDWADRDEAAGAQPPDAGTDET